MANKRQLKKNIKSKIEKEIKVAHRIYRYAVLFYKYRLTSSIIYVFDRNQSSKTLNEQIAEVSNLVRNNPKRISTIYFGETDVYPAFDISHYDISHNVVYAIRDNSYSKTVKENQLSGKAFKTLQQNFNLVMKENFNVWYQMTAQDLYQILLDLYTRDLIVFTRFGTIWLKEDFKKVMEDQNILWTEMVIDFSKVPLKSLTGE